MADGDSANPQSDLGAARQQDLDGQSGGLSFSLTPGSGPGKLKVRYPGLDEFEIDPDGLKSWLQEHNLIQTPQQWTALDQKIQDAIQGGGTGEQQAPGHYNWDEQSQRPGSAGDAQAEQMNEQQSQAWQRLLDAWNGFAGYVQNLRGALASDGETVIQRVNDVITSLNLIDSNSWGPTFSAEFDAWNQIVVADSSLDSLQRAGGAVADAGDQLYAQWKGEVDRGNYLAQDLTQPQYAFLAACTAARTQIVGAPATAQ